VSPLGTLAPVSALLGALMLWLFRRTADREAIRGTVNRIQAYLLEFWLYVDEPGLIWKSWKGLLAANLRLYRLVLVPLLILTILFAPVYACLDSFYGSSPLTVGQAALVTLGMSEPLEQLASIPQLDVPDGISVESPAVRAFTRHEVSWRIRPSRPLAGVLDCRVAGTSVQKAVAAGGGIRYDSRKRVRSLMELVRYPLEPRLPAGPVEWIEVAYPPAKLALFGIEAHWAIWFAVFSLLGAALFSKLSDRA
jgi:hypothetical protein